MLYTLRGVFPTEKRILLSRKAKIVMTKNSPRQIFSLFLISLSYWIFQVYKQAWYFYSINFQFSPFSSLVGSVIKSYSPGQKTQLQLSLILKKV